MTTDQRVAGEVPAFRGLPRDAGVTAALLVVAALGWWWTIRAMDHAMVDGMTSGDAMSGDAMGDQMAHDGMTTAMSFGTFLVAWVAMMAAMMMPAVVPVVGLYRRAIAAGRAAPLPVFLAAYLLVWTVPGIPAYWAWRELAGPLEDGLPWAGRLAGGALLAAALWQVGPVKALCLRHCRSPLSFFMSHRGGVRRPVAAFRLGLAHAGFCLGCCWLLMVVLVTLGTMSLYWMAALAAVIFAEKVVAAGPWFSRVVAVGMVALGAYLLVDPTSVASIT
ncbi:MAG TPA: DUF2182 domain-containing protein [Mycobacteriales bacterium]|nr:DUF2182 domain-containing protein [Mycobacteriales bacterium]